MRLVLGGFIASVVLFVLPVQAQINNYQVVSLVESLRLAAPQTNNEGLYSEWKIQPSNITRWSRLCIGQELTPEEFEADLMKAQVILVCVMDEVFRREYRASGNDEFLAVRRAASWWVSGDPNLYKSGNIAIYTEEVLRIYQEISGQPSDFLPIRSSK